MKYFYCCAIKQGNTALHFATAKNHDRIVKSLLDAGANINIPNEVFLNVLSTSQYH